MEEAKFQRQSKLGITASSSFAFPKFWERTFIQLFTCLGFLDMQPTWAVITPPGLRILFKPFIFLAAKHMKGLKRILKPGGVITAQVGCLSKKPRQVNNWMKILSQNFGNAKLDEVVIPSFDCRWNFASSIMNS